MLEENIDENEYLYRGVIKNPDFWKINEGKPSSAIFKDSNGVSVDRSGVRDEDKVVSNFNDRFQLKAIVKIQKKTCDSLDTYVKYDKIPENEYHSLILNSSVEGDICIKSSKAKKLRDASIIVSVMP